MADAFDVRIGQYRAIEQRIETLEAEHKLVLAPFVEMRNKLRALMLTMLQDSGQQNAKTVNGTVYQLVRTSASLADPSEFKRFVIGGEQWDMLDWRANKTAVLDFADQHDGQLPPGVKVTQVVDIGVRAPAAPRKRKVSTSSSVQEGAEEESVEEDASGGDDTPPEAA